MKSGLFELFFCQIMWTVSQHGKGELLKEERIVFYCLYISWQLYLRKIGHFQDIPWPGLKGQIILIWKMWEPESVRLCSPRKASNHLCSSVPWHEWPSQFDNIRTLFLQIQQQWDHPSEGFLFYQEFFFPTDSSE